MKTLVSFVGEFRHALTLFFRLQSFGFCSGFVRDAFGIRSRCLRDVTMANRGFCFVLRVLFNDL